MYIFNIFLTQVTNPELFQPSNISLILFCNESKLCSNCNDTEYQEILNQILQPVHDLSLLLGNGQCSEAISQFFCNAITEADSNSFKECLIVRDNKCAAEWRIIENFFNVTLTSCDSFNESTNFIFARAPILSCPEDFGVFCGSLCQPLCAEISLFNEAATITYEVLNIILHTMSVIAGVVVLVICFVHKRKMYVKLYINLINIIVCSYVARYIHIRTCIEASILL